MPYDGHFRVGSVTKLFTAAVVLQLVEDRKLGLDDPLSRWLPGILPKLDGTKITVRMLLAHTSGVPEYVGVLLEHVTKDPAEQMRAHSMRELVAMVADQKPDFAPGARWAYSNTNYILLGLIAEKADGASYASQLQRRVLTPLHLSNTLPPLDRTDLPLPHAVGYTPGPDGSLGDITELNPTVAASAGGVISSAGDLTTFIRALLGGRLLPAGLLAEMTPTTRSASDAAMPGYGLGMMRQDLRCGVSVYGHNGSAPGFGTLVLSTLDGERALALSINTDPSMRIDLASGALAETYFCGSN
jgi:D-alanyl-D-alanine carboxypeptidase